MFVGQVVNGLKILSDVVDAVAHTESKASPVATSSENAAFSACMKRAASQIPADETVPVFPASVAGQGLVSNLQTSAFMASGLQSTMAANQGLFH